MLIYYTQISLDQGFKVMREPKNSRLVQGRHVSLAAGKLLFEKLYEAGQPLKCWSCGIEANCFIVNKGSRDLVGAPTLDLFVDTGKDVVLMTRDHIIPKSYGGVNLVENLRVGCGPCNHTRGNEMNAEDIEFMNAHPELIVKRKGARVVPVGAAFVAKSAVSPIQTESKKVKLRAKRKAQRHRKAEKKATENEKRLPALSSMLALALA